MKKLSQFLLIVATIGFLSACQSAPDAPKADAKEAKEAPKAAASAGAQTLTLDPDASSVTFIGTKPTGQHTGVVNVSDGSSLTLENGNITGGKFEMDLTSFQITDIEGEMAEKLAGHLKSDDFFDVAKYPTASFEITGVKPYQPTAEEENGEDRATARATHTVSGNLTLKGVTKNIDFPAALKIDGGMVKGAANFNIDRTQWNVVYGNDESLGDRFIRPEVNIQLRISTQKAS